MSIETAIHENRWTYAENVSEYGDEQREAVVGPTHSTQNAILWTANAVNDLIYLF